MPNIPARPVGRQFKLADPAIRDTILQYIRAGNTYKISCTAAGVGESTFYEWQVFARDLKVRQAQGEELDTNDTILVEFADDVKKAEGLAIADKVAVIAIASKNQWQAAAWYLERKYPDEWGRRMTSDEVSRIVDATAGSFIHKVAAVLTRVLDPENAQRVMKELKGGERIPVEKKKKEK